MTDFIQILPLSNCILIKNEFIILQIICNNKGDKMKKITLLTALLSLTGLTFAQENIKVYTPYKVQTPVNLNTSEIDVITEDDIETEHPLDIIEIIKKLPGITFTQTGGFGQPASIYLRGFDPKRTLVLIDGVRINDVTGLTGAQLEFLTIDDVQQIEILKGAQSGVWGADASAGVINIITKKPEEGTHAKIDLQTGSFDTTKANFIFSHKKDGFYILAGLTTVDTEGFSAAEPKKGDPNYGKRGEDIGYDKDPYQNSTFLFKTGFQIDKEVSVDFLMRGIDANVHFDAAAGVDAKDIDDPFGFGTMKYVNNIHNRFYSFKFNHETKEEKFKLYANKSVFKRSQFGGYSGYLDEAGFQNQFNYNVNSFVVLGYVNQQYEHEKSAGSLINKTYNDNGIYLTNVTKLNKGRSILSFSIRGDIYNRFQDKVTGKIGVKNFVKNIYFAFNIGTAYNIPTLYQLYGGYVGNPDLKPEDVKSFDFSVGGKSYTFTLFHNEIKNLIDYDFSLFKYNNISGVSKLSGIELQYKRYISKINTGLVLNYTYLDARDSKGKKLLRRPDHKIDLQLDYQPTEKANIILNAEYIGNRKDLGNVETGYYTVFDMIVNYQITKNMKIYGKINNLTDKFYQLVDGYETAERSYYVGLLAKF